ncbi:hypothetical protein QQ045_004706 [Rhodiola kirilowii]
MENLLEVSDQEVRIIFELNTKCRATVNLRSLIVGVPIAYKVQTSSPHKFLVNPPSGIIVSNATFQIILKPQSQLPPTFPRSSSDRFLIRAALAPELAHFTAESVSSSTVTSWFSSRPHQATHDVKLRVAFVGPLLLRHAVAAGQIDAVRSLLRRQRGLESEIIPTEAESILRLAISSGNAHMIGLLVQAGFRTEVVAKISRWVEEGKYEPLDRAETRSRSTRVHSGADFTKVHSIGDGRWAAKGGNMQDEGEALLEAARVGDVNKLKWLIQNAALMSFSDQYGMTALHVAAIKGRSDVVSLLLECGCGVEWQDAEGHTPLHLAVEGGNMDTVRILVQGGAYVNAVTERGATPLYMAQAMGYDDVAQLLLDMGASPGLHSQ